jgi:hypothetical protein
VADAFAQLGSLPERPRALLYDDFPFHFVAHLRDRLGSYPGLASPVFGPLPLITSPDERETIAPAGELVSQGIDLAQSTAAPRMTELELQSAIR